MLTGTPANPWQGSFGDFIELRSPELGTVKHTIHKGELKVFHQKGEDHFEKIHPQ